MAATGYTPISLYYSTTAGLAPTNTNLVNGELAINITDGKLYYKDNTGAVQVLATKMPSGILPIANGGTNASSFTAKSGNVAGLVFFDGTSLANDATVTDVGYDTSTHTLTVANLTNAGTTTLSSGTVNAVTYLNASKQLTANNTLTFDGTSLYINGVPVGGGGGSSNSISQQDSNVTVTDTLTTFTAAMSQTAASFNGYISGTTMTVSSVISGTIAVGMVIRGVGVSYASGPVFVTALGTGAGGTGTYTVNVAHSTLNTTVALLSGALGTMSVSAVTSGTLSVGQYVEGYAAVGSAPVSNNTKIIALGTGAGGTGTYYVYPAQTVASSLMYGGGSVTTTVDNYVVTKAAGGNNLVRDTATIKDSQGSILSRRLLGTYANSNADATLSYFCLYSPSDTIGSASALNVVKVATSLYSGVVAAGTNVAFGSSFGAIPVGLAFGSGTQTDTFAMATGNRSRWTDSVNAIAIGYIDSGPRFVPQNRRLSNDLTPNCIDILADHVVVSSGLTVPRATTVTAATHGIPDTGSNYTYNVAGTATVTLPIVGSYITASWSNGAGAAGTILDVTAVSAGTPLYVGCRVIIGYGGGTNGATGFISALGTGTGGVGTYTMTTSAYWPSTEMTVPTPPTNKIIYMKTITNNAVNSATANVIPLAGGAAGTAILPATAGKWAMLQFNGTNYEIMQSN